MKTWRFWILIAVLVTAIVLLGVDIAVRTEPNYDPQYWGTFPAWLTAAVLALSAIGAWRAVTHQRKLREEQTRPYVVVDFELEGTHIVNLVIKNVGTTTAINVAFYFDPPLSNTTTSGTPIAKWPIFVNGIPTLPPGRAYTAFFDSGTQRKNAKLPDTYKATITYTNQQGREPPFMDEYLLDLSPFWSLQQIRRKTIHDVAESLEAIKKKLP